MKFAIINFACICVCSVLCAAEPKFLLISGPSGIGKSTTIKALQQLDQRFVYIKPYTTRALREGEVDKIHMSSEEIFALQERGGLAALNFLYGNYYATPLDPITQAFDNAQFPVLDWPVDKVDHMKAIFKDRIVSIYLYVDELEELSDRLNIDSRDKSGQRFAMGQEELDAFFKGAFDGSIDCKIKNSQKDPLETAREVYEAYLKVLDPILQ